ncbi:MAG: hypothetical protein M3P27_03640 [Acidobacteriota bacterium]|nr:hypothetical protein [Acidobacteriota bacterium]
MARMLDLIKQSAAPANVMRSAAKGALALPANEMVEILVFLTNSPVFAEPAKMTLAGWDEKVSIEICSDPATAWEVLQYFCAPENRRPKLVPALLENPSVREATLQTMAQTPLREIVDMMLKSARVRASKDILHALATNHHLSREEYDGLKAALGNLGEDTAQFEAYQGLESGEKTQYEIDHAAEIAAEEGKAFELVGGTLEDEADIAAAPDAHDAAAAAVAAAATAAATAAAAAQTALDETTLKMRAAEAKTKERQSTLQKLAKMSVGERVQQAMKGTKDERYILIRDGSKVVSGAVLQSPKISDAEAETFAGMKNVQESVLRDIARSRKFMKNYGVVRSLANNPRTPIDVGLPLQNHLLVNDLKALSMNKNIGDTLRKSALKKYKEKSAPPGGKKSE